MILVDSSVWIALLRGEDTDAVRTLKSVDDADGLALGDLILLEVLQGARDERHAARIERNLRQFPVLPMLDTALAIQAAANYRKLRANGVTVRKTIDMIIATFCIAKGLPLLQADRDFTLMAPWLGLRLLPTSASPR